MNISTSLKSALIVSTFLVPFAQAIDIEEVNDDLTPKTPASSPANQRKNSTPEIVRTGFKPTDNGTRELLNSRKNMLYHFSGKKALSEIDPSKPLPTSADLTQYAQIVDQGDIGSCTGNAAGQCLVVKAKASSKNMKDIAFPSRLFIYYEERAHMTKMDGIDYIHQDSGASIGESQWIIQNVGAPAEKYWPYDESKYQIKPVQTAYDHAKDYMSLASEELPVGKDLTSLKRALSKGDPVAGGIMLYPSSTTSLAKKEGVFKVPNTKKEQSGGGHAVTFLGYDDNETHNGYTGYFTIANSWGQDWGATAHGQRGFIKLPYEYVQNSKLVIELWAVRSIKMQNIVMKLSPQITFKKEESDDKLVIRKEKNSSSAMGTTSSALQTVNSVAQNTHTAVIQIYNYLFNVVMPSVEKFSLPTTEISLKAS